MQNSGAIAILILFGFGFLLGFGAWIYLKIWERWFERKLQKQKEQYPDFYKAVKKQDTLYEDFYSHTNKYVTPTKEKIDELYNKRKYAPLSDIPAIDEELEQLKQNYKIYNKEAREKLKDAQKARELVDILRQTYNIKAY